VYIFELLQSHFHCWSLHIRIQVFTCAFPGKHFSMPHGSAQFQEAVRLEMYGSRSDRV
jgi:hypothetical protein